MRLTIETPRLVLRPPEHRDAAAIARCVGDLDVARMTAAIPHPYTAEVAEGWVALTRIQRRRGIHYAFLMESRDEGVVGGVGVFRRAGQPDWEVGYYVGKHAWGRGYATEGLAAILTWARRELGASRIVAGHYFDNPASRRVLEKAGFRPTGTSKSAYSMARGDKALSIDMALDFVPATEGAVA